MITLQDLPKSIIIMITGYLEQASLNSLVQMNKFSSKFLYLDFHLSDAQDRGKHPTLCWAAKRGNHSLVWLLLAKGLDINVRDSRKYRTPLHQAARHGHTSIVSQLLLKGAEINNLDSTGQTALQRAVLGGHKMIVVMLMTWRPNVDSEDNNGGIALHAAIRCGIKVLKDLLLERRLCSIWALPKSLRMGIWETMVERRDGTIRALLDSEWGGVHKIPIINTLLFNGYSPLHTLIYTIYEIGEEAYSSEDVGRSTFNLLCRYGSRLHFEYQEPVGGQTALNMATRLGCLSIVIFLVEAGAIIETRDSQGSTPIHNATKHSGQEIMLRILAVLAKKANDINVRDSHSRTPLHCTALQKWKPEKMASILIENDADVHCKDFDGATALHLAVLNQSYELVRLLIGAGAWADDQNLNLQTPLHHAAQLQDYEMVKILLLEGLADPEIWDITDRTPLQVALSASPRETCNTLIVSLLLENGASVFSKDVVKGWTPLHTAAYHQEIKGAKLLLENSADGNVADADGYTPLRLAQDAGDLGMTNLIWEKISDLHILDIRKSPISVSID